MNNTINENTINFTIREAKGIDAKHIHECNKLSLPVVYTIREYIQFILDIKSVVFVSIVDEVITGYIVTRREPFGDSYKCHIMTIAVLEKYRSNGMGKQLVDESFDYFNKKNNITTMTLNVMRSNTPAIKFYKRNGFTKYQKLVHYYGKKKHGIMMIKTRMKNRKIEI